MKNFGCRVYGAPLALIDPQAISSCIFGIKKRIRKELDAKRASDDKKFIEKKNENVRRLRIIRDELKELKKKL
jgi:hypothetical protein